MDNKIYSYKDLLVWQRAMELMEIAERPPFSKNLNHSRMGGLLEEIMRMLNKMISSLKS